MLFHKSDGKRYTYIFLSQEFQVYTIYAIYTVRIYDSKLDENNRKKELQEENHSEM